MLDFRDDDDLGSEVAGAIDRAAACLAAERRDGSIDGRASRPAPSSPPSSNGGSAGENGAAVGGGAGREWGGRADSPTRARRSSASDAVGSAQRHARWHNDPGAAPAHAHQPSDAAAAAGGRANGAAERHR